MIQLSEGALDKIMEGVEVDKPILQILAHKKLASATTQERFRLLVSDGVRVNSFVMLATQLNNLILEDRLTEFSVCQINQYVITTINNSEKQTRVMLILNIDVKIPGSDVGGMIGEPTEQEGGQQNGDAAPPPQAAEF